MIQLTDIHKAFNQGQHNEYWALSGIDLELEARRVTAFQGPSGSGKTSLLTIVGCLARPTRGRVRLHGEDISGLPERFLTEIRRRTFGFVFQQFNLIRGLSALDNVMLPAYPEGKPHAELLQRAETLLARLQLGHRRHARVEWLSGGEQQRVAIARAVAKNPLLLLCDEPTGALDYQTGKSILKLLSKVNRDLNKAVMIITHNASLAAMADRVIRIKNGRVEGVSLNDHPEPVERIEW